MTDLTPIIAAIDAAEVLTADGSPVLADATRVLRGRRVAGNPGAKETESERVEADGEKKAASGEGAEPAAPCDWGYSVEAMNRRHALVLLGSKSVVMDENPMAPIEEKHAFRTIEAFNAWYANTTTQVRAAGGEVKVTTWAKRWMTDRHRRQYSGVCFFPNPDGVGSPQGYYNIWQGYSVEPRRGGTYSVFRDHLFTNICEGDPVLFDWVFGFFADIMQRPRNRPGVALVLRGKMGTGKSILGEVFGSLIAAHYFAVDDPRYVTGNFNAHMASCLILQAEEAVWAGDKVAEGRLKGLITSKIQMIENKGVDPIRLDNFVRLIMTSNEGWVVPAGKDERRYCVLDVSDNCKENHEYFGEMMRQLDEGGREALLADLLDFDLAKIDLRVIPKTKALLEQKIRSFSSVESWWFERLMAGTTRDKAREWEREVEVAVLLADYVAKADLIGVKRRAAETEMGMDLRKLCPGLVSARPSRATERGMERVRIYRLPPLDACRAMFEAALGQTWDWGDGDDERAGSEG